MTFTVLFLNRNPSGAFMGHVLFPSSSKPSKRSDTIELFPLMPFSRKSNNQVFIGLEALCHLVRVCTFFRKRIVNRCIEKENKKSLVFNNIWHKIWWTMYIFGTNCSTAKGSLKIFLTNTFPSIFNYFWFACICLLVVFSYLNKDNVIYLNIWIFFLDRTGVLWIKKDKLVE